MFIKSTPTFSDRRPAVGVRSLGLDSGIGSFGLSMCIPGQPTQTPFPLMTTGATAVTRPPALKQKKRANIIKRKRRQGKGKYKRMVCECDKCRYRKSVSRGGSWSTNRLLFTVSLNMFTS